MTTSKTLTLLLATLVTTLTPGARARAEALSCAVEPVAPLVVDAGCADTPSALPIRPASLTRSRVFHQVRYHLTLPATRPRILERLAATAELNPEESAWIAATLPRQTFTSGAEVLVALFPDTPADVLARVDRSTTMLARR